MAEHPTHTEDDLIELSKLRWHCRRGVKELDVVLSNYLEKHYLNSSQESQMAFKELLQLEDPYLMSLVMNYDHIDDQHKNVVLNKMKNPYT